MARQLRGIYFIDPNDEEYRDTMKNARRKLDIPMAPAIPCKRKSRESYWRQEHKVSASPDDSSLETGQSPKSERGHSSITKKQKKVLFASLMDICHLKNAELEQKFQKKQWTSGTPW